METATQTLHRLTSVGKAWYEWAREDDDRYWGIPVDDPRVVQDLKVNDTDRFPWFYKHYDESLPRIELPRDLPWTTASTLSVLAGTAKVEPQELDLPQVSRLLHLSAGVVRTTERPYTTWLFRAAGSAGGRFPMEVYVAVPEGHQLSAGVHWYHPQDHALITIGPPPHGGSPTVVVTGVPWRTGWRYRERGYRHIYWDSGTMLSQVMAAAGSAGLDPHRYSRFPDAAVAELVGADRIHEWPVAAVALGSEEPAIGPTGPAAIGEVDWGPLEFPLETAAQKAGELDSLGSPWDDGEPVDVEDPGTPPVETVILTRGSQRRMDPTRGLSEELLRTSMAVALRGIDIPHFVAVHDVEGVEPGLYRWPDLATPIRAGLMRDELFWVALEQGLAADAAFVVVGATDVSRLDDREYREAQLGAGLVEGRLHLAAYALGASACGMTFLDEAIPDLLGEPLDALLFTCVGVPAYRSTPGGTPGTPTPVRLITPR